MKKIFSLFAAVLMAGSMMAVEVTVKINVTNSEVTGSYANKTFTVSDITFGFTQWMKSTNIQAKKSTTNSLYNDDAIPGRIKSVTIFQTGTARAVTVFGGNAKKPTTAITAPETGSTMAFDFGTADYDFFSMTTPGNAVYMDSIIIVYEPKASNKCAAPSLTDDGLFLSAPYDVTITNNELGATVYYTLDGTDPTTSSANFTAANKVVSISDTTTVKAMAVLVGKENSAVASATYNYVATVGDGTKENPFTVSDVVALQNPGAKYWAIGTIVGTYVYIDGQNVFKETSDTAVATNIAISNGVDTIAVQLNNGSSARTNLNVVNHPENVGAVVKVNGTFENYILGCGVKGVGAAASYEIVSLPLTFEVAKTAETITITPSDLEAPYYVGVLNPTYAAAFGAYTDAQKLAFHANLVAGIESQAALAVACVTGVQTITLADYTVEGNYIVVAGAMHYDAAVEGNINGFVIDSKVASETFTVEVPVAGLDFTIAYADGIVTATPNDDEAKYIMVVRDASFDAAKGTTEYTDEEYFDYIVEMLFGKTDIKTGESEFDVIEDLYWFADFENLVAGDYKAILAPCVAEGIAAVRDGDIIVKNFTVPGTTTAIDNVEAVKATKVIENGQVVIIREGVRYNAVGAKL